MTVSPWNPRPDRTLWGDWRPDLPLQRVLDAALEARASRVMLTGPAMPSDWWLQPTSWEARRIFADHETPAAAYARDGHVVELRRADEWFGSGDYSRSDAEQAWQLVERALRRSGRTDAAMFRSPGATGLDLWLRTMGGEVPAPLPDDVQELIRAWAPQHRIELMPPAQPTMPAVWVLDGRWMYAALLRELGTGPAVMLTAEQAAARAADPYARGRYLVEFSAPDYWRDARLPGLLLSPAGDNPGDGWHAPMQGVTWCDAAELQLARRYEWATTIREGIALHQGRPLDTWGARLIRARESVTIDGELGDMVRAALRSILLHTVGSFHSRGREEQAVTASPMQPPRGDGWQPPTVLDDGRAIWRRDAPEPSERQLALRHPEFSAAIWGRAHVRIMETTTAAGRRAGVLATPAASLVSIYGDALMTTVLPGWARDPDDGKPGRLRVKGHLCGPIDWPTSARERDDISRAATAAGNQCTKGCDDNG